MKGARDKMSLTKYEILIKTAECGSFTRAAEKLNFTQSGISHAVSSLEEELGTKLVVRSHGGVSLTADGRELLPYFSRMCALQHQLEQKAQDLRGLNTGLVKVAAFTSVYEKWMPGIVKSFSEMYPQIKFDLLPSNINSQIEKWVRDGDADCGFVSLPTAEEHLDCWLLQRDQWKAIVACDHPLANKVPFPPKAFEQYPVIMLDEGDDYEINRVFDMLNVKPNIQYSVQQDPTILAMVSSGLGISLTNELMLQRCAYPLVARDLPQRFYRNIGICVKDKNAMSLSTQRFIDHVRRWVALYGGLDS